MLRFEDIGNTPLAPLTHLAGEKLEARVLVKDESKNPTGTHKDRKSAFLIRQALEQNVDTLTILTAGNAGYSLATLAQGTGLRIVTIISKDLRPQLKHALAGAGAELIEADFSQPLTSETMVGLARKSSRERILDVTNNGHEAYRSIFDEVASEEPNLIVCPLGSGELYLGLIEGVQASPGNISVIGAYPVSTSSKADKLSTAYHPLREKMLTAQMLRATERGISHGRYPMHEDEIEWCVRNAPEGLDAEPSALVPLGLIHRLRRQAITMIMVSTGNGKVERR